MSNFPIIKKSYITCQANATAEAAAADEAHDPVFPALQ